MEEQQFTMTHLYLIRHGEALSAIKGLIGDTGLSPLGILQAERLRDRLAATKEIEPDVLIASTLPRARQTAEIVAPAFGALPLLLDDEIQELRPGLADGMTEEEYDKKYGFPDFTNNPFQVVAPEGENWGQFMLRVGTALDRIIREHEGKTIVLFCHGGIIDGSFLFFFRMSSLSVPPAGFYTRNTSITHWHRVTWKRRNDQESTRWRLINYNDAVHLYDIGTPERIAWHNLLKRPASDGDRPTVPLETE